MRTRSYRGNRRGATSWARDRLVDRECRQPVCVVIDIDEGLVARQVLRMLLCGTGPCEAIGVPILHAQLHRGHGPLNRRKLSDVGRPREQIDDAAHARLQERTASRVDQRRVCGRSANGANVHACSRPFAGNAGAKHVCIRRVEQTAVVTTPCGLVSEPIERVACAHDVAVDGSDTCDDRKCPSIPRPVGSVAREREQFVSPLRMPFVALGIPHDDAQCIQRTCD